MRQHMPILGANSITSAALPPNHKMVIYGADPLALLVLKALTQRAIRLFLARRCLPSSSTMDGNPANEWGMGSFHEGCIARNSWHRV